MLRRSFLQITALLGATTLLPAAVVSNTEEAPLSRLAARYAAQLGEQSTPPQLRGLQLTGSLQRIALTTGQPVPRTRAVAALLSVAEKLRSRHNLRDSIERLNMEVIHPLRSVAPGVALLATGVNLKALCQLQLPGERANLVRDLTYHRGQVEALLGAALAGCETRVSDIYGDTDRDDGSTNYFVLVDGKRRGLDTFQRDDSRLLGEFNHEGGYSEYHSPRPLLEEMRQKEIAALRNQIEATFATALRETCGSWQKLAG